MKETTTKPKSTKQENPSLSFPILFCAADYSNESNEKTLQVQEQLNHITARLNILENVIKMCALKEGNKLDIAFENICNLEF